MKNEEDIKKLVIIIASQFSDMDKKELIDAIAAGSKLTKADAGRLLRSLPKKEIIFYVFGRSKADLIDAIASHSKLTKADAGRMLDVILELISSTGI